MPLTRVETQPPRAGELGAAALGPLFIIFYLKKVEGRVLECSVLELGWEQAFSPPVHRHCSAHFT